jgi:hypothetical protein
MELCRTAMRRDPGNGGLHLRLCWANIPCLPLLLPSAMLPRDLDRAFRRRQLFSTSPALCIEGFYSEVRVATL